MKHLPFPASADSYSWKRRDHLPKGFRLYSNAQWVRDIKGIARPLTPEELEFEKQYWMLNLNAEPPKASRYMSLTQRVRRYWEIDETFKDIKYGIRHPKIYIIRPRGQPFFLPNHGPSEIWRARTKDIWASMPANDSDIFARPSVIEKPKLAHLADKLAPLLQWARMGKPLSLDATNWMQADNGNYFEGEEPAPKPASNKERRYRTGPEPKTLIKMAGHVRMTFRLGSFKGGRHAGDYSMECSPWFPATLGKLVFSNGAQHESCYVPKDDKAVMGSVRMPRGAILHYQDEFTELLGAEPDLAEEARKRSYWHKLMSYDSDTASCRLMEPVRFKKRGRIRRKVLMTQAEQLEVLATQPHPPITYCKPGLPCGHNDIGEQFVGGWISSTKGRAGFERWEDVSDELSRRTEFVHWAAALPPEQVKAMDLASTVANFREIGEAFGKTEKNAERYGQRILIAANKNSKKILAA